MVRIKVYHSRRWYLARKGATLKEMESWGKAYNKHNKDQIQFVEEVADRKKYTKRTSRPAINSFGIKLPKFRF